MTLPECPPPSRRRRVDGPPVDMIEGGLRLISDCAELMVAMTETPEMKVPEGNTTLVCICTDAALSKREAGMVARAATAGIARAVDPTFTPVDGDIAFCMASGTAGRSRPMIAMQVGAAAATVTAAAIRGGVRAAAATASRPGDPAA